MCPNQFRPGLHPDALPIHATVQANDSLILLAQLSWDLLLRGNVNGAVGYAFRLIASGLFDLLSGAAIVLVLAGLAGAMSLFNRDAHA